MKLIHHAAIALALLGLLTASATASQSMPDFGGVETAPAEATGFGITRQAAILGALDLTLQQTNGMRLSSEAESTRGSLKLDKGNSDSLDASSENFAENIKSASSGAIRSFEVLSAERISRTVAEREIRASYAELDGETSRSADLTLNGRTTEFVWRARIRAQVLVYRAPEDARPAVAVATPRVRADSFRIADARIRSEELQERLRGQIQSRLAGTGRFVMADRSLTSAIDEEVGFIQSGRARIEDTARVGQQVSADLVLVVSVNEFAYNRHERELRMSDRTLVSYSGRAEARVDLLNATTGLNVMSDTAEWTPPSLKPTTLARPLDGTRILSEMLAELAASITDSVIRRIFPVSVIALQGTQVVLSQGGDSVEEGSWYELVLLGDELTDPQTGLSLGRSERKCCMVRIDRVEQKASYGSLATPLPDEVSFEPGMLELRRRVPAPAAETETEFPTQRESAQEDDWSPFKDMERPADEDW